MIFEITTEKIEKFLKRLEKFLIALKVTLETMDDEDDKIEESVEKKE